MAHSPETKLAVRSSYVHERLPIEDASAKHGVSRSTGIAWKKKAKRQGDDWDRALQSYRMAQGGLGDLTVQVLEDFVFLFKTTMEEMKNSDCTALQKAETLPKLSDAYIKTVKAAGSTNPAFAKLAIALEVLELQTKYIAEHHRDDLARFSEILEPFGAYLNETFEKQTLT